MKKAFVPAPGKKQKKPPEKQATPYASKTPIATGIAAGIKVGK